MTTIAVYNAAGEPCSLDWLREKYGPFVIYNPPSPLPGESARTWRINALREKIEAPATIVVRAKGDDGEPVPGIKVAWYWPDAPQDTNAGPLGFPFEGVTPGRTVQGYTNANGDTGFAMGDGAYYYPGRGERGPHAVWIYGANTRSQLILGLGMLPGTAHDHFDVEFTLVDDGGEEEAEGDILYWLEEMSKQLHRIAAALEAAACTFEEQVPLPDPIGRIATALEAASNG